MAALYLLTHPLIIAAALITAFTSMFLLFRDRKPWLAQLRRKPLLTANEAEFFHRLQRALPGFHVFPQVSFAALHGGFDQTPLQFVGERAGG